MNKVILIGRLVRDPELKYSQGNNSIAIARYTLAIDRAKKKDSVNEVDYINCVAFGKQGEFADNYFKKGMKVAVEGRWQTGNYINKDGQKVYTNDCVIDSQEFCESKSRTGSGFSDGNNNTGNGFMNIPEGLEEELPFM